MPSTCFVSIKKESGTQPPSKARPITSGLSAMNIAFAGSARLTSWFSVSRAKMSSSGAEKDVMGMMFAIKTHFQLFNIEAI